MNKAIILTSIFYCVSNKKSQSHVHIISGRFLGTDAFRCGKEENNQTPPLIQKREHKTTFS